LNHYKIPLKITINPIQIPLILGEGIISAKPWPGIFPVESMDESSPPEMLQAAPGGTGDPKRKLVIGKLS